jgi:hypothetical protein
MTSANCSTNISTDSVNSSAGDTGNRATNETKSLIYEADAALSFGVSLEERQDYGNDK